MSNGTIPNSRRWLGPFLLGLALAGGLVMATFLFTRTILKTKLVEQTIDVKGYAERKIVSDRAIWVADFGVNDGELTKAYEKLRAHQALVLTHLEQGGIHKDMIDWLPIRIISVYKKDDKGNNTNTVESYWLEQELMVRSDNVGLIAAASRNSSSLIQAGVQFKAQRPDYLYTKINDLKADMLAEATRNARQRAEQLASNSGSEVGPLRTARQGVFQITPVDSTEVSDSGENDTSSVEKVIKAVVTVQFAIK